MTTQKAQPVQVGFKVGDRFKWNSTVKDATVTSDVFISKVGDKVEFSDSKAKYLCFAATPQEISDAIIGRILVPIQVIPTSIPASQPQEKAVKTATKAPKVKKVQPVQASLPIPVPPPAVKPVPASIPVPPAVPKVPVPPTVPQVPVVPVAPKAPKAQPKVAAVASKVTVPAQTTGIPEGFTEVAAQREGKWTCFCGKSFNDFKQIGCHVRIQHNPQEFTLVHVKGIPTIIGKNPKQQVARPTSIRSLYAINDAIEIWYERELSNQEVKTAVAALRTLSGKEPSVALSGEANALITCVFVGPDSKRA